MSVSFYPGRDGRPIKATGEHPAPCCNFHNIGARETLILLGLDRNDLDGEIPLADFSRALMKARTGGNPAPVVRRLDELARIVTFAIIHKGDSVIYS